MGHPVTRGHKYRDLVLQMGFGQKAENLALQTNYCCKIQSENGMATWQNLPTLRLKQGCFANDDVINKKFRKN
jgi:hypothetical protein